MASNRRTGLTQRQVEQIREMKQTRRELRDQLSEWGPESVWPVRIYSKALHIRHQLIELSNVGIAHQLNLAQWQVSVVTCENLEATETSPAKRVPVGI